MGYSDKAINYNKDRLFLKDDLKIKFDDNSVWGVVDSFSGYETLLNEDIPVIFLRSSDGKKFNSTQEKLLEKVDHIYIVSDYMEFDKFIKTLNKNNYRIKNYYGIYKPSFVNYNNYIYIFEIEKSNKINSYQRTVNFEMSVEKGKKEFSLIYGISSMMHDIEINNAKIEILYNDKVIDSYYFKTNDFYLNQKQYNLDGNGGKIKIRVLDEQGNECDWIRFVVINEELS